MTRGSWYAPLTALTGGLAAGLAHPPFGLIVGLLGYSLILLRLGARGDRSADNPEQEQVVTF